MQREVIGNVCFGQKIQRTRVSAFASRQFHRAQFPAPVFSNRADLRDQNRPLSVCPVSRTSALLAVDLFLAEQIGNRQALRRSIESGHKVLETL